MMTRSEPVYYVTSGPMYGALRMRDRESVRKSRDASRHRDRNRKYVTDAILNFTHDDVAAGRLWYHPLPPVTGNSAAMLEDAFTFVLTARNSQPVADTLTVELLPAAGAPSTVTSSTTNTPAEVASASEDGGADKILIVVIVAILTLLAIIGLVVFTCVRSRRRARRRKLELAAAIDGSRTAPTVVASVDRGQTGDDDDDGRGPARPSTVGRRGAPPPPSLPVIIEPSSTDSGGDVSPTASTAAAVVIPNSPPSVDPAGPPRSGYVRVLPPSPPTSPVGPGSGRSPARLPSADVQHGPRSVWKEQVTFDWEHVDPELLQHCRKTNPVLHKNQYWV